MAIKIVDGGQIHSEFNELLKNFMPYAQEKLGYDRSVEVQLVSDPKNAKDPLGKTAYYDPNLMRITLFIDKRHVKDILRSLSHELVHHKQNCEGQLSNISTEEGYAQNDPHLREMEYEAENLTNTLLLRDWEDKFKGERKKMNEDIYREAWDRANKLINEMAEPMASTEDPQQQQLSAEDVDELELSLKQNDKIPPEVVKILMDRLRDLLIPDGGEGVTVAEQLDEAAGTDVRWCASTKGGKKITIYAPEDATKRDVLYKVKRKHKDVVSVAKSEGSTCAAQVSEIKNVTKKIKKRLEENSNWARRDKDMQLFRELQKRWCK